MVTCTCGTHIAAGRRFCTTCGRPTAGSSGGAETAGGPQTAGAGRARWEADPGAGEATAQAPVPPHTEYAQGGYPRAGGDPVRGSGRRQPAWGSHIRARWAATAVLAAAVLAAGVLWGMGTLPPQHRTAAAKPATPAPAASAPGSAVVTPAPPDTVGPAESAGARQVDGLLDRSADARRGVQAATSEAGSCVDLAAADTTLGQVVTTRQQVLDGLSGVDTADLPNGDSLVADLTSAEQDSLAADQSYLDWVRDLETGCPPDPTTDTNFAAGQRSSSSATVDKQRFLAEWAPVAAATGLAQRTEDTI